MTNETIAKLQRAMARQRTDLGNKDLKIEKLAADCHRLRRILRNALEDAPGWRGEAKGEFLRRER